MDVAGPARFCTGSASPGFSPTPRCSGDTRLKLKAMFESMLSYVRVETPAGSLQGQAGGPQAAPPHLVVVNEVSLVELVPVRALLVLQLVVPQVAIDSNV